MKQLLNDLQAAYKQAEDNVTTMLANINDDTKLKATGIDLTKMITIIVGDKVVNLPYIADYSAIMETTFEDLISQTEEFIIEDN